MREEGCHTTKSWVSNNSACDYFYKETRDEETEKELKGLAGTEVVYNCRGRITEELKPSAAGIILDMI